VASAAIGLILIALAFGAFSSFVFASQWIFGSATQLSSALLLFAAFGAALGAFIYLRKRLPKLPLPSGAHWLAIALGFSYPVFLMVEAARSFPHGGSDAQAIWNLHARFLYRGSAGAWKDLFATNLGWSQNDYPLLVPGSIAGIWKMMGFEHPVVPSVVGVVFGLLALGILCSSVSALARDQRGWMAGILLVATPSFITSTSVQGADIPLSMYILITIVLLQFARVWPEVKTAMLLLAGLSAGFACWTKNEGSLFVVVVFGSHFLATAFRRAWKAYPKEVLAIGLGAAPMLALLGSFRALLSPPSDIQLSPTALHQLTVGARYSQIFWGFIDKFKAFGGWWRAGIHPGTLVILFLLLYVTTIKPIKNSSLHALLIPVFMLVGYFMVYVITPYDLQWHIDTSLDRLLLQLWPACVFILASFPAAASLGAREPVGAEPPWRSRRLHANIAVPTGH
jgi:hypothetical protein